MRSWVLRNYSTYGRLCVVAAVFLAGISMNPAVGGEDPFQIVKLSILWVLGLSAFGLALVWSAEKRSWMPTPRIGIAGGMFLGTCVLATALSQSPGFSLIGLRGRYGGLLPLLLYGTILVTLIALYWQQPDDLYGIASTAAVATMIVAGYALAQAAGLGWGPFLDPVTGERPEFPFSMLGNSNFAGGYLAIGLPFLVGAVATARTRRFKALLAAGVSLEILALWYTHSRGGLIAAATALMAMALIYRQSFPRWAKRAVAGASVAAGMVAVLVLWHPGVDEPPGLLGRVDILRTSTFESRLTYWRGAARIFADHPVVGTGLDTFYAQASRYGVGAEGVNITADKPHNIFLEYASNAGVLGAVSYLVLVGLALFYGIRRARSLEGRPRMLLASFVAGLVAYLVQGFFSIDVPPLAFMGWVCLAGITIIADPALVAARGKLDSRRPTRHREDRRKVAARWGVHVPVLVVVLGLVVLGTRPIRADLVARSGRLDAAMQLDPLAPRYRELAGAKAARLATAATDRRGKQQRYEEALGFYREALRLRPGTNSYMTNIATIYTTWARTIDSTRFADADRWWRRAIASDPVNLALRRSYQRLVADQRQTARRIEALAVAQPASVVLWVEATRAYIGLGKKAKAMQALTRASLLEPANRDVVELRSALAAQRKSGVGELSSGATVLRMSHGRRL